MKISSGRLLHIFRKYVPEELPTNIYVEMTVARMQIKKEFFKLCFKKMQQNSKQILCKFHRRRNAENKAMKNAGEENKEIHEIRRERGNIIAKFK